MKGATTLVAAAIVSGTLAALDAAASIPIAVLGVLGIAGAGRRRAVRRVTWRAAAREGSPDARRLEALRRLAAREGGAQ